MVQLNLSKFPQWSCVSSIRCFCTCFNIFTVATFYNYSLQTQTYTLQLKNNVCKPEPPNNFCDINLLFCCRPIRIEDKRKARVSPRDLAS